MKMVKTLIFRFAICASIIVSFLVVVSCTACSQSTTEEVPNNGSTSSEESNNYGYDFESTWGDLKNANGGEIPWDTLTEAQQQLVHYPKFDTSSVYWVDGGYAYHAVEWCYTLANSSYVRNGTLEDAIAAGKSDPCSKCVGH